MSSLQIDWLRSSDAAATGRRAGRHQGNPGELFQFVHGSKERSTILVLSMRGYPMPNASKSITTAILTSVLTRIASRDCLKNCGTPKQTSEMIYRTLTKIDINGDIYDD